MLLEFRASQLDRVALPEPWSHYVRLTAEGLTIVGDRTAYREIYLRCGASAGVVATTLGEVLDHTLATGGTVKLSEFGISSLMHHALVPLPYTEYEDVYFLSMGDTAEITDHGGVLRAAFKNEYPWTTARSRCDGEPSEARLLSLLTASTERQLAASGNDGFLMLSSGKDSTAVALALAEAGFRHVRCVTYQAQPDDHEPPIAAGICRRLGLDHEIVSMPTRPADTTAALLRFFTSSASPGVDLSQIPYILATAAALPARGAVIDGGGNDPYMGFPVTGNDLTKLRFRIRGRRLSNLIRRVVPVDSPINYLARSRVEATLAGRTMRIHESRQLYPAAVDTSPWWYEQSRASRRAQLIDTYGEFHIRHTGPSATLRKQKLAASAIGLDSALPWCDDVLADYYFNLPESDRFDRRTGKNKILLRRLLMRYLDYDADVIGKHYFEFDGAEFIVRNMEFVRAEIGSCALWADDGLSTVYRWLDQIDSRPLLYHALLPVFMISGWHNHSRFLRD